MRALLLAVVLLCGTSFGADELPANVAAYKERCEAMKVKTVARLEKEYDESKARIKQATASNDKAKMLKNLKVSLGKVKTAEASAWHEYLPAIDTTTVGSIGEFYMPQPNHGRSSIQFLAEKITGETVTGNILHDGATPKLLVRAGGNVANNVYSAPGEGSKQPTTIIGGTGFTVGKSTTLQGLFEVVSTKPLTLKPFDVEPFKSLK